MAKDVVLLRILVSSPNEMASERNLVLRAVDELNRTALADSRVRLEAVSWETHAAPDFAAYPQQVLNRQLSDWDIYVGVLGHTFGTPTPQANSGTEEEFRTAYDRWRRDNRSCRLMFYFSDAPVSPNEIDPEQLAKVQNFRKELGTLGGLYWAYRDITELPEILRRHLHRTVTEYAKQWGPARELAGLRPPVTQEAKVGEEETAGLLDLAADAEAAIESLDGCLERISSGITRMGHGLSSRRVELEDLKATGKLTAQRARPVFRAAAAEIEAMGTLVDRELPLFRQNWRLFRESLFLILSMEKELSAEDRDALKELEQVMKAMREAVAGAVTSGSNLLRSVEGLPSLSKDLRRAARNVGTSVGALLHEMKSVLSDTEQLEDAVHKIAG